MSLPSLSSSLLSSSLMLTPKHLSAEMLSLLRKLQAAVTLAGLGPPRCRLLPPRIPDKLPRKQIRQGLLYQIHDIRVLELGHPEGFSFSAIFTGRPSSRKPFPKAGRGTGLPSLSPGEDEVFAGLDGEPESWFKNRALVSSPVSRVSAQPPGPGLAESDPFLPPFHPASRTITA
jgi:hypothetical protein